MALRMGLGFLWIYEGLVLKILRPICDLERGVAAASGLVPNGFEAPLLRALGALEIVLGVLVLMGGRQRSLCIIQFAVVGFFTVAIPFRHPDVLAHPFALLVKNVPILGAIVALWFLEGAPGGRSGVS